jgi:hypothetical protein
MSLEGYYYCGWCNFKTPSEKENDLHNKTPEHTAHFKQTYCEPCDKQCWNKPALDAHCETSKHKKLANISMECEHCKYTTGSNQLMSQHNMTQKHINAINGVTKLEFHCDTCNYHAKFKSDYDSHLLTKKHQNNINGVVKPDEYVCEACNYKTHIKSSMTLHEKSKKHLNQTTL